MARISAHSKELSEFIRSRHSPREFLPDPIPTDVIEQVLIDAQSAPSNSNTQPWNIHLVGGQTLKDLSAALIKEFDTKGITPDFTTDYGEGVHPQRSQQLAAITFGKADETSPVFKTDPGRAPLSETVMVHGIDGLSLA